MITLTAIQVIGLGSTLLAGIGVLWTMIVNMIKRQQKQLDECAADHQRKDEWMMQINGDVHELQGYHRGVKDMAAEIMSEFRKIREHQKNG